MSNKKAPQAAEAAQGTNTHIQDTTEAAKSQIDFTELEKLVYNAKAYTELLYGLALAEDADWDNYNAVDFLMRQANVRPCKEVRSNLQPGWKGGAMKCV